MSDYRELLGGCGNHRTKVLTPNGKTEWQNLTTIDHDPDCGADIEWDLMRLPLPFEDNSFDELHFYHVLEHTGAQGDYRFFFAQFEDFWRLLKPDGLFCAIVPALSSPWAFGDPGHTRVLPPEIWTFLSQDEYTKQVGVTALADYRRFFRGDFDHLWEAKLDEHQYGFCLKAVKPSRISV